MDPQRAPKCRGRQLLALAGLLTCLNASAQTGGSHPVWPYAIAAAAVSGVIAYLLGRRRGRRRQHASRTAGFTGRARLVDELDNENAELSRRVRALETELETAQRTAADSERLASSAARSRAHAEARTGELEAEAGDLRERLVDAEARNDTLAARLKQGRADCVDRPWPAGSEELESKLATENPGHNDETTVARLNRKLVLARNTIAELLEAQQQVERAENEASEHGVERAIDSLDKNALRVELRRARQTMVRLEGESQMKNDVIRALEADAVELERVRREHEEATTVNKFLRDELGEVIEEVGRLKKQLGDRDAAGAADREDDTDSAVLRALSRGGKE